MKNIKLVSAIILSIFLGTTILLMFLSAVRPEKSNRLLLAEEEAAINRLFFGLVLSQSLWVVIPATLLIAGVTWLTLHGLAQYRVQSVFQATIGQHSVIPVHYRDLQSFYPIAVNLSLAEIQASATSIAPVAPEIISQIARFLDTFRPNGTQLALPPVTAPTFRDLLCSGAISPGKPLLIGFDESNRAVQSELSDNYSTVVIGMPGSGKTSGEAYQIAQTILAYHARYTILDPHYPDKERESLGDRLGILVDLPCIRIYSNPYNLAGVVEQLTAEFEAAKKEHDMQPPHIIVVDEHKLWKSSSNGGKELLVFEEKIIFQGRKFGWYLHVTSKSPLAEDFGSTAVRDNFVTSLVYQTKPQQSHTFYKDKDLVELSQQCVRPGMAIYTNKKNESKLVNVPFCEIADMERVREQVANSDLMRYAFPAAVGNTLETAIETRETGLRKQITTYLQASGKSQNELADRLNISRKVMSYYRHYKALSDKKKQFVETQLTHFFQQPGNRETPTETRETGEETGGKLVSLFPLKLDGDE